MATDTAARAMLERLAQPAPLGDPVEELLSLGAEVRAWLEVLRELVVKHRDIATFDVAHREYERASIKLYGEQLDRAHRVLADLARLGLDERKVRVDELRVGLMVAAAKAHAVWVIDTVSAGRVPTVAEAQERMRLEMKAQNG